MKSSVHSAEQILSKQRQGILVYRVGGRVQQAGVWSSFQIRGQWRSRLVEMKPMLRALIAAKADLTLVDLQQRLAQQAISTKIGAVCMH